MRSKAQPRNRGEPVYIFAHDMWLHDTATNVLLPLSLQAWATNYNRS